MRLTELEPSFLVIEDRHTYSVMDDIKTAQGISFVCPECLRKKGSRPGVHSMICWFKDRGVPDDQKPGPGRWVPSGTGYNDLSFIGPGAASVLQQGGCNAHFYIKNGEIQFC